MKLTPSIDFFYDFGYVLGGFSAPKACLLKGSSVELPSNFQFATTKCIYNERLTSNQPHGTRTRRRMCARYTQRTNSVRRVTSGVINNKSELLYYAKENK